MGPIQVAADVGERLGQRLGLARPHALQALADAFQRAGFLGLYLMAEQAQGGGRADSRARARRVATPFGSAEIG